MLRTLCARSKRRGSVVRRAHTRAGEGAKAVLCVPAAALEDSRRSLSACMPALSSRIVQDLSESCFSYLRSALEVPRLYRRTNKVSAITEKNVEVGRCRVGKPQGGSRRAGGRRGLTGAAWDGPVPPHSERSRPWDAPHVDGQVRGSGTWAVCAFKSFPFVGRVRLPVAYLKK